MKVRAQTLTLGPQLRPARREIPGEIGTQGSGSGGHAAPIGLLAASFRRRYTENRESVSLSGIAGMRDAQLRLGEQFYWALLGSQGRLGLGPSAARVPGEPARCKIAGDMAMAIARLLIDVLKRVPWKDFGKVAARIAAALAAKKAAQKLAEAGKQTLPKRLRKLDKMREKGEIDEAEHAKLREKVIQECSSEDL